MHIFSKTIRVSYLNKIALVEVSQMKKWYKILYCSSCTVPWYLHCTLMYFKECLKIHGNSMGNFII